ncbi:hypothetical protein OAJ28_00920 [Flavobacteriaceae bacterium]|nr:hypothetical protein [Flavobacteriaceae bacterium]|tara:strand:+ start:139 stop:315 length:177 start_codon:yes stop_codon:yes gene_type:complete
MEKNKLVKIVSIITGTSMIGAIIYFVFEGAWDQVAYLSSLFFLIWLLPNILKNINKKQ